MLRLDIRQETKESSNGESLSSNMQEDHPEAHVLNQAIEETPVSTEDAKQLLSSSQCDSNDPIAKSQESSHINSEHQQIQGGDEAYLFEIAVDT